ncbi:transmembrane protein 201 [Salarias fasciatus]|uniref:Transmembrane protein 201 n=1 Tax=Salarias fasciatus TaxID=181472 RepID=A0A672GV80_SALFA|nr:transmembrane protein 201 [Salarias fasciatus]
METFNKLLLEYPGLMYSGVGATAFVAGGALIYKIASRKKPTHASVNCWFCNDNTVVPYGNRNCWDCPNCDQYNGFQENGDYNKPIPAQYMEDLNHGVSGQLPSSQTPKGLQYVNCQMLLCRKCNNNQSLKIKQLASYTAREDENYDEEIEVYKHHLEQTYKLCRPCQTAVEYYIKYQNRQLRTVLLDHQLRRTRESNTASVKSSQSVSSPLSVVLLRLLAFLICAFLVATSLLELPEQPAAPGGPQTLSGGIVPPKPQNESAHSGGGGGGFQDLLQLLPDSAREYTQLAWRHGRQHQLAVVSVGLLTCLTAIFLAGPVRLRRIDAVSSVLWFLLLCLHLAEGLLFAAAAAWLETARLVAACLCCSVGCAAAVATRKPASLRRIRYQRYLAERSAAPSFVPTPPPNLSKLLRHQQGQRELKASPTVLSRRFSSALSLGRTPPLSRTGSGFLFSGTRPASLYKDSGSSDYLSLKSGSRPSSPGPSPPSLVTGSVASSCGSDRRRPLICPARFNLGGQRLRLSSLEPAPSCASRPTSPTHFHAELSSSVYGGQSSPDTSAFHYHDGLSYLGDGSVLGETEKQTNSSGSSAGLVGTTTPGLEGGAPARGVVKRLLWPGLLLLSFTTNLLFSGFYLYQNWR